MSEEILGVNGQDDPQDLVLDKVRNNQEHRLIARLAKRAEWVIPDKVFETAPKVMAAIVDNDQAESRERIQASRTLVMMQNANTGQASVDVRINQAIAIVEAPASPDSVDLDIQPAYIEVVNTDQLDATIAAMEENGLLGRYVDQVKTSAPQLPSNGNGHSH